ncbi:MAG TPA: CPBP family intramembrane metalloprotease [Verrucomicrobia bacterium]|nr:CPBP family intramembrane metalloprotease [Verrucomicrobiota bacterium]HOB33398.1 type II CAAX endopeptidase family protein [Verrucomicrobiota bacterium]HOP98516.1 type II CAAX endopeptidase family protein [Verrucomicrobiota bacterium]
MQAVQATEAAVSKDSSRGAWLALALLVPVPSIGTAAALWWWPDLPVGKILFVAAKVWILALPLAWLVLVERSRPGWSPPHHGGFGVAIGTGLAIAAVIVGAYALVRKLNLLDATIITERAALTGLNQPAFYIGGALYWILFNSLMEEYVWRWFVFRKAEAAVGGRAAVVVSALGFTAHHVIALAAQFTWPITVLASLGVFIGGVTWSWLYLRYRSIWPCYVSHAIVDTPIFLIGWRLIFHEGTLRALESCSPGVGCV